jgi:hypothetical protein
MHSRLQNNKVFQAALKQNAANNERLRLAQLPSKTAASPSLGFSRIEADPTSIQRTNAPQVSSESLAPQSNAPTSRQQYIATPQSRPASSATFALSPSVTHDPSPGDRIAKRQRTQEAATHSPPLDRKRQQTPSTQMRPSDVHLQRVDHPHTPCQYPASPLALQPVSRPSFSAALPNRSPPTPERIVSRTAIASSLFYKSPVLHQQPPVQIIQTYASQNFSHSKPLPSSRSSHTSSFPPLNEPTPVCTVSSGQRAFPFQVSAGFQNDGNTCYLRYFHHYC